MTFQHFWNSVGPILLFLFFAILCGSDQKRRHEETYNHIKKLPICILQISSQAREGGGEGGGVKEKRERRCNYHEHSLRDQLHFKEARAPRPMLQTAPSTSVVRVGKHEQITRLLIAARSEEVSTLCLPARLETLRQALAWKEQTRHAHSATWCACVCMCASSWA